MMSKFLGAGMGVNFCIRILGSGPCGRSDLPSTSDHCNRPTRPFEIKGSMNESRWIDHADQNRQAVADVQSDCGDRGGSREGDGAADTWDSEEEGEESC